MLRLLLGMFLAATTASALSLSDGRPRHMEEDLFKTVTEYLTGEVRDGRRLVLRSQPQERTGQYFILQVEPATPALPAGAEVLLEVLPSDQREIDAFRFIVPPDRGTSRELYLGLTGNDWSSPDVQPVAWRVRVRQGDTLLTEWKSFLWEMP